MTEARIDFKEEFAEADLNTSIEERLKEILLETMLAVELHAKRLAPVKTGLLRATIHTEPKKPAEVITVSDGTIYGVHQEFGTMYCKAQPFMRPAMDIALAVDLPLIVKKYAEK